MCTGRRINLGFHLIQALPHFFSMDLNDISQAAVHTAATKPPDPNGYIWLKPIPLSHVDETARQAILERMDLPLSLAGRIKRLHESKASHESEASC
jgi:hypothetical protein